MPAAPPEAGASGGTTPQWREFHGRRVTVHAPADSQALRLAPALVRQADRCVAALDALLGPGPPAAAAAARAPARIYLVDPVSDLPLGPDEAPATGAAPGDVVGPQGILRVAQDPSLDHPIAESLARLLVARWFGAQAATADRVVTGIAGVVAARTGTGPALGECDEWVRAAIRAGEQLPGPGSRADGESVADGRNRRRAATSFVAFLTGSHPPDSLRRFLTAYDPTRRDAAALAAFGRPFAGLEQAWRSSLGRPAGRGTLRSTLPFLWSLLAPQRWRYAEVLAWQLAAAVLGLGLPVVSGCVVGEIGRPPDREADGFCRTVIPELTSGRLATVLGFLAVVYVLQAAVVVRRGYLEGALFSRVGVTLRDRVFTHLHRLPHQFHLDARQGDLVDCVSSDTDAVQSSVAEVFGAGASQAIVAAVVAVAGLTQSLLVGVVTVVVLPLLVLTQRLLGERTARARYQGMIAADEATVAVGESLAGHATVKALGLEDRLRAAYRDQLRETGRRDLSLSVLRHLYQGGVGLASALSQLAVLAVGGFLAIEGEVGPAAVATLLLLLPRVLDAMTSIALVVQSVELAWGPVEQVREVLDTPVDVEDAPGAQAFSSAQAEVRLEGVSFGYGGGRAVLRDLDLVIPAGGRVAIVGVSGAGKTTVVNLILRFWDPEEGRVLLDGSDLRSLTLSSFRGEIGLVSQDTFVFDTTLRDNIALARTGATDAEVEAAARAARLHTWVMSLPAGYDTVMGEGGARLSGGERQRLAIARAILRDPALLIADEPTSALDSRTEADIVETLVAISGGRTTIMVTQRPALAVGADRIYVLDHGRVAEEGTHSELMAADGLYRRLCERHGASDAGGPQPARGAGRLAAIPLLAGLDAPALERLYDELVPRRYPTGADIVRQGDAGEQLYILSRGRADVLVDQGGGERVANTLGPGDYFGELALLTRLPRSATVRVTEPVEALSLDRGQFLALLEREPVLRERLSQLVFTRRTAYAAAALAAGITGTDPQGGH